MVVYGGALAPRGIDRPGTGRDTHSPTTFLRDMGAAYRESGRDRPVMDAFAVHPYADNSSQAPDLPAPEHDDDRPRRLREARTPARRGVRRHRAAGRDAADPLRRVRRRDPGAARQGGRLQRHRANPPRSTRDAGPRTTAARSRSPRAHRTSSGSCSSTRTTSRCSTAGSRACTTSTARGRRAWTRCATPR